MNAVRFPCFACREETREDTEFLCPACRARVPEPTRAALGRSDGQAPRRLKELLGLIAAGTPLEDIRID